MPQVKFAPAAIRDLQRLRDFLRPKSANAALRAGEVIRQGVKILCAYPRLGRMIDDLPEPFREWPIDFGDSGYVVRYRISDDAVTILAIRHQKEAGYQST
jgi:plasmid stabilization system protein ParE